MANAATVHQQQQPFPKLDSPLIDDQGNIARPWYRLLITLWQRTGQGSVITPDSVVVQFDETSGQLVAILATTGAFLGTLAASNVPGGTPQALAPVASPFLYQATTSGTVVVFGGQVEIGRDGQFFLVTLNGGAIPVLMGDFVRVTWFSTTLPIVTFLPGNP